MTGQLLSEKDRRSGDDTTA